MYTAFDPSSIVSSLHEMGPTNISFKYDSLEYLVKFVNLR